MVVRFLYQSSESNECIRVLVEAGSDCEHVNIAECDAVENAAGGGGGGGGGEKRASSSAYFINFKKKTHTIHTDGASKFPTRE